MFISFKSILGLAETLREKLEDLLSDDDREDDQGNHFQETLDRLKKQGNHCLKIARNDTAHWRKRLEAAGKARKVHKEWLEVFNEAEEQGYHVPFPKEEGPPDDPRHGLCDEILGDRKGQVGLELDYMVLLPPVACEHAQELERRREDLLTKDKEKAEQALEEAKQVYWSLIRSDFIGSAPYRRLCSIYQDERPSKVREVARLALDEADLTERQREGFESQIERAKEEQSG